MLAGGILRYLERTTMNKLSYHDASIATIVDKINELVTYINKNGNYHDDIIYEIVKGE